jgi:hypothetical protein
MLEKEKYIPLANQLPVLVIFITNLELYGLSIFFQYIDDRLRHYILFNCKWILRV